MSTQHTPGPWVVSGLTGLIYADDQEVIVGNVRNATPEQAANARLIEAAPDLLEELEQQADGTSTIISLLRGQTGPVAASLVGMLRMQEQAARYVIARARGDAPSPSSINIDLTGEER